ncbi:tetratricopeptide repeat protein [Paenibacillus sp. YYML68]|uniref:tetratricopeptide repeat protein n=1 Tax=Paenibacillus sp. YYML68 TaxID=2909250 RepID=UPI002490CF23|nr:tetratricopeptide repeat protein [Paenibacillus sp. YYML68]
MVEMVKQTYRYSEAPIWELQRAYYEQLGMKAWNNDQVPQYITNSPMIATAYAETIFGLLQDRAAQGELSEPVTIVELGAGAGRLAYHVLQQLGELVAFAGIELPPYRYVITDLPVSNVNGWRRHPALQPYVQQGLVDFAVFDAVNDTELKLVESGEVVRKGDLKQPVIVIANYFFDGIPQELLYMGGGQVYECDIVMEYPKSYKELKPAEALESLTLAYEHRRAPEYEDESFAYRELISLYLEQADDSHILFPSSGLSCLERLNALSRSGFLLITADKGDHRLEDLQFADPPQLVIHGSFSLTANYHALVHVFEQRGAEALFTEHHYKNINIGCILMLDKPKTYVNTRLAFRRFIERFGPDEFCSMKEWLDQQLDGITLQPILAFWRLGGYDAEFFIQTAQRIVSLLPEATDEELLDLRLGINKMWDSFYVMEQRYDLALDAGLLLFEMNMYEEAKRFLDQSVQTDPEDPVPTVLYCLAICSLELGLELEARYYLGRALELEPEHEEALALLECLGEEQGEQDE